MTRSLLVGLAFTTAALSLAHAQTQRWELSGKAWGDGAHQGTAAQGEHLTLAPDAKRGVYRRALPAGQSFDSLLVSLNHDPWPAGARVETHVRLRVGDAWTEWLPVGVYGHGATLPRSQTHTPGLARVLTDVVRATAPVTAAEVRLVLHGTASSRPRLRRLALSVWTKGPPAPEPPSKHPAWGRILDVPQRSQKIEAREIAGRICSPTSLSMVMEFWGKDLPTAAVARGVYDHGADIYGNWSLNVAFASTQGFVATATHMDGLLDLEAEIAAGRPVVISHRFKKGDLGGAPMSATDGHLIVVAGFTPQGDVVVNDPAANPAKGPIRRVYKRTELRRTWLTNAEGVAYTLHPRR